MNLKKDIKDFGLFMITPVPAKFHFEGVDNKRAARQLLVICAAAQVVVISAAVFGPVLVEETRNLKSRVMKRFKKD